MFFVTPLSDETVKFQVFDWILLFGRVGGIVTVTSIVKGFPAKTLKSLFEKLIKWSSVEIVIPRFSLSRRSFLASRIGFKISAMGTSGGNR